MEHVHVAAGGQAIVGNVETSSCDKAERHAASERSALTDNPGEVIDLATIAPNPLA